MIKIPLTNQPNQSFNVVIPIGDTNITLGFFIYWNRIAEYWEMNLTDIASGAQLISGLPLLPGRGETANLLRQFAYLGIGEAYVVPISQDAPSSPGVSDWGVNYELIWGP